MTEESLELLRRAALNALSAVEIKDRELSVVMTGDCGEQLAAYLEAIKQAREKFERLERKLLEEFLERRTT